LAAHRVFIRDYVKAVQENGARVWLLQRGDGPHERRFAGAIGSQQAKHVVPDGQAEVFQSLHAVGIALGQAADFKAQEISPSRDVRLRGI